MWTILVGPNRFCLGAALVTLVHATKFGELNLGNPVTGRYIALLPGAKVRDLVGPYAYHLALFAFLREPRFLLFVLPDFAQHSQWCNESFRHRRGQHISGCSISIVRCGAFHRFNAAYRSAVFALRGGAAKLLSRSDRGAPTPDQARREADERYRGPRRWKQAELSKRGPVLISGEVFATVQTYGDVVFYKLQLERLGFADPGAPEKTIRDSSSGELRGLIQPVFFVRWSPRCGSPERKPYQRSRSQLESLRRFPAQQPRYLLTGIAASGLVFSLCILTMAHIFALLSGPVASLFSKPLDQSLWPNGLRFVGDELWMIVPPIFVCLIIAVTFLVPASPLNGEPQRHHGLAQPLI